MDASQAPNDSTMSVQKTTSTSSSNSPVAFVNFTSLRFELGAGASLGEDGWGTQFELVLEL